MTVHDVKILPEYYEPVAAGKKRFEIRRNDRDYHDGDVIHLREWTQDGGYTGRVVAAKILYILDWTQAQGLLPDGYVAMTISIMQDDATAESGFIYGIYDNDADMIYDETTIPSEVAASWSYYESRHPGRYEIVRGYQGVQE